MKGSIRLKCSAALVAALCTTPLTANAQARPLVAAPQVRAMPGVRARPLTAQPDARGPQTGPTKNALYGTVVSVAGNTITIRTRNGHLRRIDASPAIAAGTWSAPMYVGKPVVAEGVTRVDGVLTAARVSRLTRLERSNPDR